MLEKAVAKIEPALALGSRPANHRQLAYRGLALALAVLPLSLLALASRLQPASSGLGTHQQLGLPPCTMRMMFGIRCPSCGMTTSWTYFSHGDMLESLASNCGGCLLAIYSLVFAAIALKTVVSGCFPGEAVQRWLALSLLAIVAVTLTDWSVRLWG